MAREGTTLPLGGAAAAGTATDGGGQALALRRWRLPGLGGVRSSLASAEKARIGGAVALTVIVLLSALIVVMAANRPSLLSPTTHANYFPGWMAGPLGGLWPGLTRHPTTLKYDFTGAIVVMYVAYLALVAWAPRLPARWVLGAIGAVHAILLLAPPLALTDIFNYINYARMEVVHHLNPYTTIPILEPHNDPSFVLSNWHELLSPYGPLFTLLTFAVVPLGLAASFWVLKMVLATASLAMLALVWGCAKRLDRNPVAAVAFVGLNPIVLMWGLGGDHNDFLTMLCIMLGFYLLLGVRARSRIEPAPLAGSASLASSAGSGLAEIGAGAAFVAAAGLKASAAVLIPVALASLVRRPRALGRMVLGMILAGAVIGAASLIAFGLHIPDLSTQSRLVTSESVPNLIGLAVGAGGASNGVRAVMTAALAVSLLTCCWMAARREEPLTAAGWASVALLLTLGWVLPWYVVWALPLAALSRSRALRRATLLVGVYLIVVWSPASARLWNAIHFSPEKTPLGRLHQRYIKELLN